MYLHLHASALEENERFKKASTNGKEGLRYGHNKVVLAASLFLASVGSAHVTFATISAFFLFYSLIGTRLAGSTAKWSEWNGCRGKGVWFARLAHLLRFSSPHSPDRPMIL